MGLISAVFVGMVAVACVTFAQAPPPASPAPALAEPELFVPSLALIKDKEGKYTLVALTYMPNSCYRAILAKEGFPAKETESDAEGVQLIIKTRDPGKLCAKMKWPVIHQLAGLKPGKGKTMIWAYVVQDGKVQGKAKVSLSSARDINSLVGDEVPAPF
ncbi:MAG: hypothetical protein Q7R68_00245 [Nitrospirales bacterium]|nr:hypothetical protein [Nitrospirales bacterium]